MPREERAPRPGQGTPIANAHFGMRNSISGYFVAKEAGATPEQLARRKQLIIDDAEIILKAAQAL